jgi:hypothetical protein
MASTDRQRALRRRVGRIVLACLVLGLVAILLNLVARS